MKTSTKAVLIAAGALIIVALIVVIGPNVAQQLPSGQQTGVVPASQLEQELSKANIILSEVNQDQVRTWLRTDPAFQTLAQVCLGILTGKKLVDPVPLDVIMGKYRELSGVSPSTYLSADKINNVERVKTAIFKAWSERHEGSPQKAFEEILESR